MQALAKQKDLRLRRSKRLCLVELPEYRPPGPLVNIVSLPTGLFRLLCLGNVADERTKNHIPQS